MGFGSMGVLDRITRTCYNASNKVVAVQHFIVSVETIMSTDKAGRNLVTENSITDKRFLRTGKIRLTKTDVYHTSESGGGNKTVSYIVTTGAFNQHDHAGPGGDTEVITYTGNDETNDLSFNLLAIPGVMVEGDVF